MMSQKRKNETGALWCSGAALLVGMCIVLSGCARELTPYGKARKADTIEAYEEFIRANSHDPRARFARDRIEVLRLLDAHRSGNTTMAAPNRAVAQQRVTDRAEPTSVRQGPWNLTASPPRSSTFTLDLYDGDIDPVPHKLRIDQEGELVRYTLQHGAGPGYYLTASVPFASFGRLWAAVVSSDIGSYGLSYGRAVSMGDYRGNLVIEVDTGTERLSRVIRLEGLNFEDRNLRRLLSSMAQMHPADQAMHFLR